LDTVEGLAVVKGRSYPVPKINWGSIDAKIHVLVITTTLLVIGAMAQSDSDYQGWMKSTGAAMAALTKGEGYNWAVRRSAEWGATCAFRY
jgi:hypothetical protein